MKVFIENIKRRPLFKEFDFPQVPREGETILFEEYDAEDKTSVITDVEATVEKVFDCTPAGIVKTLQLKQPIYRKTASYGHFGREGFPWEKTDKVEALKAEIN